MQEEAVKPQSPDGIQHVFTNVQDLDVLGTKLDTEASTRTSVDHRMSKAEACFWANHQNYTGVGNVRKKLAAWSSGAISVACFGCCSWHVSHELMLSVQRWEFRWLRKVLRLRRKPQESLEQYNRRTFGFISDLSQGCRHRLMHHRVLAQVFKHA